MTDGFKPEGWNGLERCQLGLGPHVAEMGEDPADWTCVLCDHGIFDTEAHPRVDGETVFRAYRP
jgi:hypothetical protein